MTAENKKKNLKNSYSIGSWLKNKIIKLKGVGFFNASQRQAIRKETRNEINNDK